MWMWTPSPATGMEIVTVTIAIVDYSGLCNPPLPVHHSLLLMYHMHCLSSHDSHRTVAELLKEREGATDDILVSYLEEELRKYKGQRLEGLVSWVVLYESRRFEIKSPSLCQPLSHDTLLDQLAVAHSLLRLYSQADEEEEGGSGTIVDRARITIEVAALRRSCKDLSDLTVEGEKEER